MKIYLIHIKIYPVRIKIYLVHMKIYLIHMKIYPVHIKIYLIHMKIYPVHIKIYLVHMKIYLLHIKYSNISFNLLPLPPSPERVLQDGLYYEFTRYSSSAVIRMYVDNMDTWAVVKFERSVYTIIIQVSFYKADIYFCSRNFAS